MIKSSNGEYYLYDGDCTILNIPLYSGLDAVVNILQQNGFTQIDKKHESLMIFDEPKRAWLYFLADHIEIIITGNVYDKIKNLKDLKIVANRRLKQLKRGYERIIICRTKSQLLQGLAAIRDIG